MEVSFFVASSTAQTKRTPLRATVRISRCSSPLSPTALRVALIRLSRVRVRHDPAAPNRSDKIVLANHAITVLDEIQQQVEHLRLKRDELRAPPKLPTIRIEYLVFKAKLHGRPRRRFSRYAKVYSKDNSSRCRSLLLLAPQTATSPHYPQPSNKFAPSHCLPRGSGQGVLPARNITLGTGDQCPLWVKSRHRGTSELCPLYPR